VAKILIVGSGFSGAVVAQQLAAHSDHRILVVDERSHIAGNCYTERDVATGVMVHVYGPHIFNTSNRPVWDYVRRFGEFGAYTNRVKAVTDRGVFTLPINLLTINQLFGKVFNPREAEAFVKTLSDTSIGEPANFEEQALKMLGRTIYETFLRGYTLKQWGCDPKELPTSVLKRLPVRFNYDDNYYTSRYQGIPINGYTALIHNMLADAKITLKLKQKYDPSWNRDFDYVFYSGPLDAYFDFKIGRLGYRTVTFEPEIFNGSDYQGNPVINYCQASVPYTRIHEHRHFTPWEEHTSSIFFREYCGETGPDDVPFYPKQLRADVALLAKYRELAENEEKISFIGRLGTYRYMDMHHVIGEAIDIATKFSSFWQPSRIFPSFPGEQR
jgi:UDP-galactopyranose mutase